MVLDWLYGVPVVWLPIFWVPVWVVEVVSIWF